MRASARRPARKILPLLANGARQFLAERLEPRSLFSSYGLTAIASLPALATSNPNASNNTPVIRDSAGNLYGIDPNGGPNGAGTIFKVDATTHALTPLVSFDGTNGVNPVQIALDSHGNIFGVTHFDNFANGQAGASEGSGVLFEIPANNQTTVQTIYAFTDNSIGQFPQALVLDSSDNIYCLTTYGGANNAGSIVKIAAGTFSVSTVASLPGSFQSEPNSLTLANGNFYGTTLTGGGSDLGTFFELPASTTTFNVASFSGTANGASPDGAPLVDANGNIYGTTEGGGANGLGTIYQYSVSSNTLTAVASVPGALGSNLVGNLVEDSSGNLYGAIQRSGTDGAIYELNGQTLQFISLAQFNLTNGGNPLSGLVADSSGNFYGITFTGGANSTGAFYEASPGAAETAPTGDFAVSAPAGKFPGAVLAGAKQVGGATVQITYNGTVTLTKATVTTTLYASLTQIHDSSSVQVGAAVTTKVATLKPGQSFKIPFAPFNYPTAAEDYYLVSDVALNGTLDSYDSATSSPTIYLLRSKNARQNRKHPVRAG